MYVRAKRKTQDEIKRTQNEKSVLSPSTRIEILTVLVLIASICHSTTTPIPDSSICSAKGPIRRAAIPRAEESAISWTMIGGGFPHF